MCNEYFLNFKQKANNKYYNKFNYDKFIYVNAKTESVIICPIHGEFTITPDNHLKSKYGCKDCFGDYRKIMNIGKKHSNHAIKKDDYLNRLIKKYGNKYTYDLSNYKGITNGFVILKCKKHGDSKYNPRNLLKSGYGCKDCGYENSVKTKTKDVSDFIQKANVKHNNKYTYDLSTYKNRKSIVKIFCKQHGVFEKRAQKHLSGQGCFKCKINELIENNMLIGLYNEKNFKKNIELQNKDAVIYYLSINNGEYYKIGISTNLKDRLRSIKNAVKTDVELIDSLQMNLYSCFQLEQFILDKYKEYKISDSFSTELFYKNILNNNSLLSIKKDLF